MQDFIWAIGLLSAGFGIGVVFMSILFFARDSIDRLIDDDEHDCDGIHVVNIKGIKDRG